MAITIDAGRLMPEPPPSTEICEAIMGLDASEQAFIDRTMIEIRQSRMRELAGIIFNGFVRLSTGLPYLDTQCGFKAFRRERARICFEQQRSERFGFDPELLYLAKRHGLTCAEVPVRWAHDARTKVNVVSDSIDMFFELLRIQWNNLLGRYPRAKQS